jgi:hypothetical protein
MFIRDEDGEITEIDVEKCSPPATSTKGSAKSSHYAT